MSAFSSSTTKNFFCSSVQMDLSDEQRAALAAQGLADIGDFFDFGKDELDQAIKNMRTSIPAIPAVAEVLDSNNNVVTAAVPAVPPVLPIIMPAKSTHRLEVASIAWHYYTDTSRAITTTNMHYTNVLQGFYTEWKAIVSMAKETPPDVPCITKNNPPLKWTDTFLDYCNNTFGVRKAPLAYVIRENVEVLPETRPIGDLTTKIDPLLTGKAHGDSGSVLEDLKLRLSHSHPLFKTDNAKVFSALEEATRNTVYSSTVRAFARRRDGRGAWKAIVSNHAGSDKWELLQKENMKWLLNTKWTGRNYSLEKFCNQHRTRFVNLEEAQNHVDFQLPTEHTRVGYLIDNLDNSDPDLRAAIANIRQNVHDTRSDFEAAVGVLLPVDPYKTSRRQAGSNNGANTTANISYTGAAAARPNDGIGKSGVHFRFHTGPEYQKLNKEQRSELHQWRETAQGKKFSNDERKKRKSAAAAKGDTNKAAIKSAVKDALERERKRQKQSADDIETAAKLIADVSIATGKPAQTAPSAVSAVTAEHKAVALKLINTIKDRSQASNGKKKGE